MTGNVDNVKALEHELGRCRKKVADQQKELAKLGGELEECRGGARELAGAVDALYIAVAVKYGAEVAPGVFEARLPAVRTEALLGEYRLEARAAGKQYVLRAVRKEA